MFRITPKNNTDKFFMEFTAAEAWSLVTKEINEVRKSKGFSAIPIPNGKLCSTLILQTFLD
jgi:hypothetical protein